MAKCGIEKYDELPGRVALIDVDAARYALREIDSDSIGSRLWLWHPMAFFGKIIYDEEKVREEIIDDLEEARKIHTGEMEPFYASWLRKIVDILSRVSDKKFENDTMGDTN